MRENQKGYSLVELIVVIAIMAIVVGTLTVVLPMNGPKVNECATTIEGALKETRTNVLSRESAYMSLNKTADGKRYEITISGGHAVDVGDNKITIRAYYELEDGSVPETNYIDITAGNPLILSYNRASGAFRPMIREWKDDGKNVSYYEIDNGGAIKNCYCTRIEITRGNKTKNIHLVKDTGKVYLDE